MSGGEVPRPELARLAERVIRQELRSHGVLLEDVLSVLEAGGASSGLWAADRDRAAGVGGAEAAIAWASEHVQRWAYSAADHAETLLLLFRHEQLLPVPAWTLGRAILEAVLQTCWLLDAEVSSEARIARAATVEPAALNESIVLLGRFDGHQEEVEEKRQVRSDLEQLLVGDGFVVERAVDKKGRPTEEIARVTFGSQSASTRHNITQLALKYIPDDPWLYGLLSGAAHGKPWLLRGLSDDVDEVIRSLVLPLLPVSDAYTRAWCRYFDLDPEPHLQARRRRVVAMRERGSPVRGAADPSVRMSAFGPIHTGRRYRELGR